MSDAEQRFFAALCDADAGCHWVFTKVRMADLVTTRRGLESSERHAAFNRIKAKHVDFALCDRQTLKPVLVIELDDASHNAAPRQRRDAFVDEVYGAVGLPILHVKAKTSYDSDELLRRIQRLLSAASGTTPEDKSPGGAADLPMGQAAWLRSGQGADHRKSV